MSEAEYKQQPENDGPGRPAWQGHATDELEYIRNETDYISSIAELCRSEIKSRFNLPFAVNRPFSMVNGSELARNVRTCL